MSDNQTIESVLREHRHYYEGTSKGLDSAQAIIQIEKIIEERVIGADPNYGEKQPQYVQKIEAQVRKVKGAQRQRLKSVLHGQERNKPVKEDA